ncbi:MAG TPA: hypothetical protein VH255_09210, partial [Verrucomicrobiae bacterium]|nr:hypothetical protein [Verrucomicrobiae bacterium]
MKKIIRSSGIAVVETMEARMFMSAAPLLAPMSLSVAVNSSTLPSSVVTGTPIHGNVTVTVTNLAVTKAAGPMTLAIYAVPANGTINSTSPLLASTPKTLSIPAILSKTFSLNVKSLPSNIANGTYDLVAKTTDSFNDVAVSPAGPSIAIAAPFIHFSETEVAKNLTDTVVGGVRSPASILVSITNSGNVASKNATIIDIFSSTNGRIDGNSTLISGVSRSLKIQPGKTTTVPVKLGSFPNLAHNTYDLIAEITDEKGAITTSPASLSVVISPPFVSLAGQLSTMKVSVSGPHSPVPNTITAMNVLKITNNGTANSTGTTSITTYLSTSTNSAGIFTPALASPTPKLSIQPNQTKSMMVKSTVPAIHTHNLVY